MKIFDKPISDMTIITLLVLSISMLVHSCSDNFVVSRTLNNALNNLKYFKDYRTNLCFAQTLAYNISYVPCTPEVERLIVNAYPVLEK